MSRRGDEAIQSYETALVLEPERAETHYGLGTALAAQSPEEAIACFERAVAIDPDYAEAHCALGAAFYSLARHEEALVPFERALVVDPDYAEAHRGRAAALQALRRHEEAVAHYEAAASLAPDDAGTRLGLGSALQSLGRHDAALQSYRAALAAEPDRPAAHISIGSALHELGRITDARAAYETAIACDPRNVRAHYSLCSLARSAPGDPRVAAVEALAQDAGALSEDDRILLDFALGKALAETGEHERAFRHLLEGNRLRRGQLVYDEAATLRMFERISAVFTPELMRRKSGFGHRSALPVFIVGMPRSGSTLVEQILASHPQVFGAGERPDLNDAVRLVGGDTATRPFPEPVPDLTGDQIRIVAAEYLRTLGASAPAARRIIDKMLANFCLVGLIHLALPNARIIHTCRDSIDTCLSCFATLFDKVPYAYDLGELGRNYRGYRHVMEHWRQVIPAGVMLDVRYETLVRDFEPEVRRILAHCGLEWDDACLAFYKTERSVRTASTSQVRQPLYRNSLRRWRPPESVLRPLIEGLGELASAS